MLGHLVSNRAKPAIQAQAGWLTRLLAFLLRRPV
jgi:hypothetical protein